MTSAAVTAEPAKKRGILHHLTEVDAKGLRDALEDMPVRMTTMGRTLAEDPSPFLYAALAGRCAATLAPPRE